eukprot:m.12109 g.12109  ORF g.12109 m.12109 type:complete len:84 (+) comp9144_c0_seq1:146-397(+)
MTTAGQGVAQQERMLTSTAIDTVSLRFHTPPLVRIALMYQRRISPGERTTAVYKKRGAIPIAKKRDDRVMEANAIGINTQIDG